MNSESTDTDSESSFQAVGTSRTTLRAATATRFEAQQTVDEEIAWHYTQIGLLKAKRNAMAPISALPNELMTRIFTIFAAESNSLFNLKWTKIIYVCHHWYALAQAAHPLWGYIDLSSGGKYNWMYAQFRRSGAAPLSVKIALYEGWHTDHILSHSDRIHELQLTGEAKHVYDMITRMPNHNFPMLSSLSLDPSYKLQDLPVDFVQALPNALFDGRLPSLRELKLISIAFPPRSLSDLTTLSLSDCNDSSTGLRMAFGDVLDMLSSSPRLCSLKLNGISPPITHQDYPTLDLPDLDHLRLRGMVTACTAMLNHLRFSAQTNVHILPWGIGSGVDVRDILVPIRKHIRSPGAQTPFLLHIDRDPGHCALSLCRRTECHSSFDCDSACALLLNSHPSSEAALRQIIAKFLKAIPESVTHLDVCLGSNLGEASWKAIVPLLPALETVYIYVYPSAGAGLRALNELESLDPVRRTFPSVRHLYVSAFRHLDVEDETVTMVRTGLEGYVRARFDNGTPLETLEFEDQHCRFAFGDAVEESLERMFPLMQGQILRNGVLYDPVKLKKEREEQAALVRARMLELGLEIDF
ncbi:F-box domain-containing protein [Mycena sanguinolenta]|uniref:F-box domain-containing protein n=1 Tax=Mycena sanguinolenta TaxID=230812 RepID=A0A8H6Y0F7_9AGAR|nr:F-box domain-containing protein [Mycena sanguinolenta]